MEDIISLIPNYNQFAKSPETQLPIVEEMNNSLEQEENDIFSNPNNTFFDPCMKSGRFIKYIVKKLFTNSNMIKIFPDNYKRIKHILENQVYGMSINSFILKISLDNIFCNEKMNDISRKNFKPIDTTKYVKEGKLKDLIKKEYNMDHFDVVISNPPYDENLDKTIYNFFMDSAFEVSKISMFITPAKFLSNGGKLKKWNEKMLSDKHLKVIKYFSNSFEVFPNVSIKGGIVITIRDTNKNYNNNERSILNKELENIKEKIIPFTKNNMSTIVSTNGYYKFNNNKMIRKYAFERSPEMFNNTGELLIYGRQNNERITKHIDFCNVIFNEEINKYKIFIAAANGSGSFGEKLSESIIGKPNEICTETYLSIGSFDNILEAENCLKYIKTKFFRCLLGILKITQLLSRDTFSFIPLQDFTEKSDIDWTKNLKEIDQQLYKKYNFTKEDIEYIENNVKEMN